MRPLVLALVGALAGAGLAFGFQTLRPPPVDTTPPPEVEDGDELANLPACDQVRALEAQLDDMQVELTDRKADLVDLEGRAAESIGVPTPWPAGQDVAATTESTRTALTASLEEFGGTLLELDCSEDPCVHASIFMGPDADGQGFADQEPKQGHVRVTTLSGNGAEDVPHQLVIRTVDGPESSDGDEALRIAFRMQQAYSKGVRRITFEPLDPKNPKLGWKITEDEPAEDGADDAAPTDGAAPPTDGE